MKVCSFTLEYYISESNKIPFKDWLEGLKDIRENTGKHVNGGDINDSKNKKEL
ncbi:MAG: hypothetical protein AAB151_04550 [Nitrospirota bacterium]